MPPPGVPGRGPAYAPDAPPAAVAELAVVGYRGFVRRVYLLDEAGRRLASLPAAGLDGQRLSALARAAGILYSRYEVDRLVPYESSPVAVDCFPWSPSYVRFEGPPVPVAEDVWTVGERDGALPDSAPRP
jgi:hypothetical protein